MFLSCPRFISYFVPSCPLLVLLPWGIGGLILLVKVFVFFFLVFLVLFWFLSPSFVIKQTSTWSGGSILLAMVLGFFFAFFPSLVLFFILFLLYKVNLLNHKIQNNVPIFDLVWFLENLELSKGIIILSKQLALCNVKLSLLVEYLSKYNSISITFFISSTQCMVNYLFYCSIINQHKVANYYYLVNLLLSI